MAALLAFLLLLLGAPLAAAPADVPLRLGDGRTLNAWCAGRGTPLVLLDGGWAASSRGFGALMAPLARHTRVCALDRAGAGRSDPAAGDRHVRAIAADALAALDRLSPGEAAILVGHSAGGLYLRQAALAAPARVAGLLLIDPTLERQSAALAERFGPGAGSLRGQIARARQCLAIATGTPPPPEAPPPRCGSDPPATAAIRWQARLAEIEALEADGTPVPRAGALGDMPLVVLTADRPEGTPAAAFWAEAHGALAALSSRGRLERVPGSGHMIQRDRPDAVIAAVEALLAAARPGVPAAIGP